MKQGGRFGLIVALGVAALLAAGGAVTAYSELEVFSTGGLGPETRFAALVADSYAPGSSLLSKRLLLDTCLEASTGFYGMLQPAAMRRAALQNCLAHADAIGAEVPSYSYAWFIGALIAAEFGDAAGFNIRMGNSQITGPAEQWVAELRANQVEEHFSKASPAVLARHEADLKLLVASDRGIAAISARYLREPAFRERITQIVETMPERDQARFISVVRSTANAAVSP